MGKYTGKFKVGDRVVVVDASHGWGDISPYDIGEITEVSVQLFGGSYRARFPKHSSWVGDESCFILAVGSTKEEIVANAKIVRENEIYKVLRKKKRIDYRLVMFIMGLDGSKRKVEHVTLVAQDLNSLDELKQAISERVAEFTSEYHPSRVIEWRADFDNGFDIKNKGLKLMEGVA